MKKHILSFALIAGMIGSITTSCSSQKNAGSGDTTKKTDTTKMSSPVPTATDTLKKDTTKKDTTHH